MKYVATAKRDDGDPEWQARLAHHAQSRPRDWETIETAAWENAEIVQYFAAASGNDILLVDSVGGWLDAQIARNTDRLQRDYPVLENEIDIAAREFSGALATSKAHVIAVGEEAGWGIVPLAPSARLFRDVLGRMQQRLAAQAREAFLVVSGFAIDLRAAGRPVP